MNEEQKLLCRELLSIAVNNQLKISNTVSSSVLEQAINADLRALVQRGLVEELSKEMVKRSVIERSQTDEHFGQHFRAVVWAFTPDQIAKFALACFERGVKVGEVAL